MSQCKKCLVATAIVGATLLPSTQGNEQAIQELKVKDLSGGTNLQEMIKKVDDNTYDFFKVDPSYDSLLAGDGTRRRLKKKKNCVIL